MACLCPHHPHLHPQALQKLGASLRSHYNAPARNKYEQPMPDGAQMRSRLDAHQHPATGTWQAQLLEWLGSRATPKQLAVALLATTLGSLTHLDLSVPTHNGKQLGTTRLDQRSSSITITNSASEGAVPVPGMFKGVSAKHLAPTAISFATFHCMEHAKDAPAQPNNSSLTLLLSSDGDGDSSVKTWDAERVAAASYGGLEGLTLEQQMEQVQELLGDDLQRLFEPALLAHVSVSVCPLSDHCLLGLQALLCCRRMAASVICMLW